MRLTIFLLAAAAAGAAAPGAAKAQLFWQPGEPAAVPYPPGGGWNARSPARAAKPACEKMCENDFSPCDPIYFKTEDGRCAGINFR